jgi:hypothetical protein
MIEIDATLDVASGLGYLTDYNTKRLGELMVNCFKMLSGLIASKAFH